MFNEYKSDIINYLINTNNILNTKKIVYTAFKKQFPAFIKLFEQYYTKEDFRDIIYCIINDIDQLPVCPICNKRVHLKNFVKGFYNTCSKKCQGLYQKTQTETHKKVSNSLLNKQARTHKWIYNYNITSQHNNIIFHNYCKHGDVKVYAVTLYKIHDRNDGTFCIQCNEEIINNYIPTDIEINTFIKEFPDFYKKYNHNLSYSFFQKYFPHKLAILIAYYNKYIGIYIKNKIELSELYYVVLNNIKSHPICACENCNNQVKYIGFGYNKFCEQHAIGYNTSAVEIEFYNFLKSLKIKNIERNNRSILNGKEIDFLFPDYNIGIEFNGCLWHSTFSNKDKNYHYNKRILAKNKNVNLYTIWEDSWNYKQDIIKSIIKDKFNIYDTIINGNDCIISTISHNEINLFLEQNDIKGKSITCYNLGLFYNNELISAIIFNKTKNINEYKILRYCNKLNYNVTNSFTIFINYFISNFNVNNIILYNNYDLFNDSIYNNFIQTSIKIDYLWLYNGKRVKNPKIKQYKCYNSGLVTLEFKQDKIS